MKYELKSIDNPHQRSRIAKLVTRKQSTAKVLKDRIMQHEAVMLYIRFALKLEQAISQVLDEADVFDEVTLPEMRQQIGILSELVSERQGWIKELIANGSEKDLIVLYEEFEKSLR